MKSFASFKQGMEKYPGWVLDAIIDLSHMKRGLEGRLRRYRGGLVNCTITNWAPAVIPHQSVNE